VARPSKLTPERQQQLVAILEAGVNYEHACQAVGISYECFRLWMKAGEAADSGRLFEFAQGVRKAEATLALRLLACINKAARDGEWRSACWLLERRFPEDWGRRAAERRMDEATGTFEIKITRYDGAAWSGRSPREWSASGSTTSSEQQDDVVDADVVPAGEVVTALPAPVPRQVHAEADALSARLAQLEADRDRLLTVAAATRRPDLEAAEAEPKDGMAGWRRAIGVR
jgi:transposase